MQIEDMNKIINNIKATMAVENQNLTNSDISLLEDFAQDKISMDDAMNYIKKSIFDEINFSE